MHGGVVVLECSLLLAEVAVGLPCGGLCCIVFWVVLVFVIGCV